MPKAAAKTAATAAATVPAIRSRWPGLDGRYAGVAAGVDGAPDHHLVLLDALPPKLLNWDDSLAWAASMGADLPTPEESALIYAHLREYYAEKGWYWTNKQYSSDNAWGQLFGSGGQITSGKKFEARARLVRRLPLQSFNPSTAGA